jgi:hypothetical protein
MGRGHSGILIVDASSYEMADDYAYKSNIKSLLKKVKNKYEYICVSTLDDVPDTGFINDICECADIELADVVVKKGG